MTAALGDHHAVAFFVDDAELVTRVASFAADAIARDDAVVLVATEQHLAGIRAVFGDLVPRARTIDATELLERFVVDGVTDWVAFRSELCSILDEASAGDRRVSVYGEMVGLLWARGAFVTAVELEGLWNDLVEERDVVLLCGYMQLPGRTQPGVELASVCDVHTAIDGLPFVRTPEAIADARHLVTRTLARWRRPELRDDAAIVVSELTTNAVRHARSPFRLSIERTGTGVRIAVADRSTAVPVRRHPSADDPGGRGVALVDGLSASWGVEPLDGGKVVWSLLG